MNYIVSILAGQVLVIKQMKFAFHIEYHISGSYLVFFDGCIDISDTCIGVMT